MLTWKFLSREQALRSANGILNSINHVIHDGFGSRKMQFSIDSLRESLEAVDVVALLYDHTDTLVGFWMFRLPDTMFGDSYLIYESKICLAKTFQRKGLSIEVLSRIKSLDPTKNYGWLSCRTQNPIVMKRYRSLGMTFPIDGDFSSNPIVGQIINYFQLTQQREVEMPSGIFRALYSEGRLGDYPERVSGDDDIYKYLTSFDFRREQGDALLLITRLNK